MSVEREAPLVVLLDVSLDPVVGTGEDELDSLGL